MEDPFDQSGLDDIKGEEFSWQLPKPIKKDTVITEGVISNNE
jgi:hypothetical protein